MGTDLHTVDRKLTLRKDLMLKIVEKGKYIVLAEPPGIARKIKLKDHYFAIVLNEPRWKKEFELQFKMLTNPTPPRLGPPPHHCHVTASQPRFDLRPHAPHPLSTPSLIPIRVKEFLYSFSYRAKLPQEEPMHRIEIYFARWSWRNFSETD